MCSTFPAHRSFLKSQDDLTRNSKLKQTRFHGVMVSTQDSESCDPSSNLGRTYLDFAVTHSSPVNLKETSGWESISTLVTHEWLAYCKCIL